MKKVEIALCLVALLLYFSANVPAEEAYSLKEIARQYRQFGYAAQEKGDLQTARQFYEKAIALDPSYAVAHNDLGIIYEALGAWDKAERQYLCAIKAEPGYMPAYTNLALLYEKEKRQQEAKYYWKQRYLRDPKPSLWREEARKRVMLLGGDEEVREVYLRRQAKSFMDSFDKNTNNSGSERLKGDKSLKRCCNLR